MSSESNFSYTLKHGVNNNLLTVRGDTADELEAHALSLIAKLDALVALDNAARGITEPEAVANVVAAFEGTVVAAPAPAPVAPVAPQPVPVAPAIAQQFVAPAPVAPPAAAPAAPGEPAAPACTHGPMKLVAGGISKKTGKPYNAFWACQWPNRDEQCRPVS